MSQIHWLNAVNGSFTNASDWGGGIVPGAADDAILDAVGSAFTVSSGADETVDSVQLASNATLSLTGGTFTATAVTGSGDNAGVILIGAGATMIVGGTLANTGTIALDAGRGHAYSVALRFNANATLTGGGEIVLSDSSANNIGGILTPKQYAVLYNDDNTISGAGSIGDRHLNFVNEKAGTVNASGTQSLAINGRSENGGLVEATGSGGLDIKNLLTGFGAGVVLADDGSIVRVEKGGAILGGTLEMVGSGIVALYGGSLGDNVHALTLNANVVVRQGGFLAGTIVNNGTIALGGADLYISRPLTLKGAGLIALQGGDMRGGALTLASGTIIGSGRVGGFGTPDLYGLAIGKSGVIDNDSGDPLSIFIDAGLTIANAGTIEATGAGGVTITSPIDNSGLLAADAGVMSIGSKSSPESIVNTGVLSVQAGGKLLVHGAVSGDGHAIIAGGTLEFFSSFDEAVKFTGKTGTLQLAKSQAYTETLTGFAANGKNTLDLRDIAFVGAGEATFSGTASGGVLTVTDGTNTANINLKGNYLGSTFVASSDGDGGTNVVAEKSLVATSALHAFVSAIAGLGAPAAIAASANEPWVTRETMLSAPRIQAA